MLVFDGTGIESNRPWDVRWYKIESLYHNVALFQIQFTIKYPLLFWEYYIFNFINCSLYKNLDPQG